MRLDKFLKVSMLFKTRSSAEKSINQGNVAVNGKASKPSINIKTGDILKINFPLKNVTYKILEIHEKNVSRETAKKMTEIIGEEKFEI